MKGLKQDTLAEILEMSPQGYGKIERNETDISISKLSKIAKALDVSVQQILSFEETKYFINSQTNSNNEKVVICHSYHEMEAIDQCIKSLIERLEKIENKLGND